MLNVIFKSLGWFRDIYQIPVYFFGILPFAHEKNIFPGFCFAISKWLDVFPDWAAVVVVVVAVAFVPHSITTLGKRKEISITSQAELEHLILRLTFRITPWLIS